MLLYRRADRRVFYSVNLDTVKELQDQKTIHGCKLGGVPPDIYEVIVREFKYIINAAAHHSDMKDAIAPRATKLVTS